MAPARHEAGWAAFLHSTTLIVRTAQPVVSLQRRWITRGLASDEDKPNHQNREGNEWSRPVARITCYHESLKHLMMNAINKDLYNALLTAKMPDQQARAAARSALGCSRLRPRSPIYAAS
jgi:hypothetical protein